MSDQLYVTMSDREKYLFDLQGFLVIHGILSNDEIRILNEALDANQDKRREGTWTAASYGGFTTAC